MPYTYAYPRPAVCTDCVVFGLSGPDLEPQPAETRTPRTSPLRVLLIRRDREPFAGAWALPGGFIEIDEPPREAAFRELYEETSLRPKELLPLGAYGAPDRDPRGRTISLVFTTVVATEKSRVRAGDDAREAAWRPARRPGRLAFDHREILRDAQQFWRQRLAGFPFGADLLPRTFTAKQLQTLYEAILGRPLDGRRLIAWLRSMNVLERQPGGEGKRTPARYHFVVETYRRYARSGFPFPAHA
ncbi:NUDIX domain-containing protein [Thermostilla marina]